jgi:phage gp29-like protein
MAEKKKTTSTTAASGRGIQRPDLDTEVANRLRDPFEQLFSGLVRTNDPLLLERGGNSNTAFELYRDLKRDGKVFDCLQKRKLALASREWQVEPVVKGAQGEADALQVTEILKQMNFDVLCNDLMDALLAGFVPAEVVWSVRGSMIVPSRVVKRAQKRFVYVQEDENRAPDLRLLTRENMLTGEQLPERKFIVHRVNPEDDNPYGTGLGLQLYWPVFFKRKGILAWNKLNDRFGSPTPWGKYPRGSSPQEKNTLFAALKAMSNDGVLMTPEGTMIELLESKLTGTISTQQALCEYMDDWIAGVLLGQEPRASGGGALAAASKERADVRLDLVQGDSNLLNGTLNETLIKWICELNGLAPCQVVRPVKEEEDLKALSETDKNVSEMGFKPSLTYVRSRYGDGWEEAPKPEPTPAPAPARPRQLAQDRKPGAGGAPGAQFAEGTDLSGQEAIDAAIAAVSDEEMRNALAGIFEPLLKAIEQADTFEDALAAAEAAYPQMDTTKLQHLLARAMFGAEAFGTSEAT